LNHIGVVGAGTMGAGIAQVAGQSGFTVTLFDVTTEQMEAGLSRIRHGLDHLLQRGRMSPQEREDALSRLKLTETLVGLSQADLVIEAAPEVLDLKLRIFGELDQICRPDALLATNTSSLSVTEIGSALRDPARLAGMHFFNPVPAMKLVEVIRGARTSEETAAALTALAVRLGKTPVQAKDTPGFIVNRVARPFPGEALRLLGENVASVRQIDRILRLGGGFRMGPFELMDLVGMDVNFAVNRSVFEQFFGDPRFRPHPLQARMVKANLLGRKTGAGWYRYENGQAVDGPAPAVYPHQPGPRPAGLTTACVEGDEALQNLAKETGYTIVAGPEEADLVVAGHGATPPPQVRENALVLVEASAAVVTEVAAQSRNPGMVVGYGGVPSVAERRLVELAAGVLTSPAACQAAVAFFQSLGRDVEIIHDGAGLVLPRVLACLINEAAYALAEGVASAADIDVAMRLGTNYPRGPLEWADALGPAVVLRILEGLERDTGDDRYRPCPLIRRLAAAGGRFHDSFHAT